MTRLYGTNPAFGHPGVAPRWTPGNKDGVGTAHSFASRVWFTLWNGIVTEVYYPMVDRPQVRDLQFLVTDGQCFFHEEARHLHSQTDHLWGNGLGYRITNVDPEGRYTLTKDVITHPYLPCVLQRSHLESGDREFLSQLRLYLLCAPHLDVSGWGNNGHVVQVAGREILTAHREGLWMAIAATIPFSRLSCGYVGASDGWTDLADNYQMDWQFDEALDGNLALMGELLPSEGEAFTVGVAFGTTLHRAATSLFQALNTPFDQHQALYQEQWQHRFQSIRSLESAAQDGGNLYRSSVSLLLAHEDKNYPGALIASMAIPWGEVRGGQDEGGYHLVWTRDLVNSVMGLLAAGHWETPLESLVYLAVSQQANGGFAQNFWLHGEPHQTKVQLDQVGFPILLAWRLHRENALQSFDPYPMVLKAASFLIRSGPVTEQGRWEELSGYSPATLASNIAALICAACYARDRNNPDLAQYLEEYADFLECHVEDWTVTTEGTLVPGIKRHYIRMHPAHLHDPQPNANPNEETVTLPNLPPDARHEFPAKTIVSTGFLELVRYGIRRADDPLIVDSLKVVDAVLKVETPLGPCWHRYNHDGFGQRDDGSAYQGWGKGRAWPLLTGERGHYELAAGHDVQPFIKAMEAFASKTGLLPEQIWNAPDLPEAQMYLGKPTGSAMPLMWAHAEYIKLLRSHLDGQGFDFIPEVAARYLGDRSPCKRLEVWKFNHQIRTVPRGFTLRIQAVDPFCLRWSDDQWRSPHDIPSHPTGLGVEFVDIPITNDLAPLSSDQAAAINFTFYWPTSQQWENQNYQVAVTEPIQ